MGIARASKLDETEAVAIDRRSLLKYAGLMPWMGAVPRLARAAGEVTNEKADYALRIGNGLVELAPNHIVSTTLYDGRFPGPLLRFKEGIRKMRGRWFPFHTGTREIRALATFHPAYLLRTPLEKRFAWRDFLAIKKALES